MSTTKKYTAAVVLFGLFLVFLSFISRSFKNSLAAPVLPSSTDNPADRAYFPPKSGAATQPYPPPPVSNFDVNNPYPPPPTPDANALNTAVAYRSLRGTEALFATQTTFAILPTVTAWAEATARARGVCFDYAGGLFHLQLPDGWISHPGSWDAATGQGSYLITNFRTDQASLATPGPEELAIDITISPLPADQTFEKWVEDRSQVVQAQIIPYKLGSHVIYQLGYSKDGSGAMEWAVLIDQAKEIILFHIPIKRIPATTQASGILNTFEDGGC